MGPNGIGKSSLIRTLSGLQEPLVGKVMNNQPHQLSVVLTDKVSATHMTVQELLTFGRYPYLNWNVQLTDEDHLAISNAINQTRIHHLLSKRLYELSDGQLQMCMLTKALAQNTPALLLDEPTAHLDLNNRVEIMNLLRRLSREEGKAILVATHELDLALQTADLIWLADNKTLITGLPEDLVLNGTFDEIFKFKGFDLKTGKVEHQPYRNMAVNLTGEGYEYLWTKNALERNGYSVVAAGTPLITVQKADQEISWQFNSQQYTSLHALLATLATT
jgi:iron complex transport system ATP-binding protein